MSDLWDRLRRLERRIDRFSLVGDGTNVIASGSVREGYALNVLAAGAGAGSGVLPPPSVDCSFFATLFCDSISASKTKCGFPQFDSLSCVNPSFTGPVKYYLNEYCTYSPPYVGFPALACSTYTTWRWNKSTCVLSNDGQHPAGGNPSDPGYQCNQAPGPLTCSCGGNPSPPCIPSNLGGHVTVDSSTTAHHNSTANNDAHTTATLSNEYTTEMLISDTKNALPGYSGYFNCDYPVDFTPEAGQGCACSSSRDLTSNEANCTIQRSRYKWVFSAYTGQPCNLRWIERFTPDSGPVVDRAKSFAIYPGMTETPIFYLLEPEEDGAITIV